MVSKFVFCGGPSVKIRNLFRFSGTSLADIGRWPQFEGRTVMGTHRGRTAVELACRLLGLGAGDEVLFPAYHCGTELDALLHAGVIPVAYRVNRHCEIDPEDLISRKTERTRAVYLIHYFGWEQPMERLRHWCDEHGLLLIEDCALALFSAGQSGAIGRTGDAAIYSLPKSLGLLRGGLLSLSSPPAGCTMALKPAPTAVWLREILHSTSVATLRALDKAGLCKPLLTIRRRFKSRHANPPAGTALPDMPNAYYFDPSSDRNRALHPKLSAATAAVDCENVIQARRLNYSRFAAALDGIDGIARLFPSLPSGVCPLLLPLLVSDRDACATHLQERGIAAFPWWAGFHRHDFDWTCFSEAIHLKNNLLALPVDQDLTSGQIDEMAGIVSDTLRLKRHKSGHMARVS